MIDIRDQLEQEVERWGHLGVPALLQRFVLGNGTVYAPAPLPSNIMKRPMKQCFRNAAKLADEPRLDLTYVEGLAIAGDTIPLLVHHAWCVTADGTVVDPTWRRPDISAYMGVPFDSTEKNRLLVIQGYYGFLDTGAGLNHKFMFQKDPELKAIIDAFIEKRRA